MGCVYWDERKDSQGRVTRPGRWTLRYADADGTRRFERTAFDRQTERHRTLAEKRLQEIEDAVDKARRQGLASVDAILQPKPAVTLRKFVEDALEGESGYIKAECSPDTGMRYKSILGRHLKPALGALPLAQVNPGVVQRYSSRRLNAGAAPATVKQELAVLSLICREAMKAELIERNPVADRLVKKPKVRNEIIRYLSVDEERVLLDAAERVTPEYLAKAIAFAVCTGLRDSEQRNLRWSDVDLERAIVVARDTKNGDDREIPLALRAVEVLKSLPRYSASKDAYVWYNPETNEPYWRFNNKSWRKALREAGFQTRRDKDGTVLAKGLRWHDLRHTFCSRLAQAGVPLQVIKDLAGHKSLEMTLRYAHLSPSNRTAAVAVFDGVPYLAVVPAGTKKAAGVDKAVDSAETAAGA